MGLLSQAQGGRSSQFVQLSFELFVFLIRRFHSIIKLSELIRSLFLSITIVVYMFFIRGLGLGMIFSIDWYFFLIFLVSVLQLDQLLFRLIKFFVLTFFCL